MTFQKSNLLNTQKKRYSYSQFNNPQYNVSKLLSKQNLSLGNTFYNQSFLRKTAVVWQNRQDQKARINRVLLQASFSASSPSQKKPERTEQTIKRRRSVQYNNKLLKQKNSFSIGKKSKTKTESQDFLTRIHFWKQKKRSYTFGIEGLKPQQNNKKNQFIIRKKFSQDANSTFINGLRNSLTKSKTKRNNTETQANTQNNMEQKLETFQVNAKNIRPQNNSSTILQKRQMRNKFFKKKFNLKDQFQFRRSKTDQILRQDNLCGWQNSQEDTGNYNDPIQYNQF